MSRIRCSNCHKLWKISTVIILHNISKIIWCEVQAWQALLLEAVIVLPLRTIQWLQVVQIYIRNTDYSRVIKELFKPSIRTIIHLCTNNSDNKRFKTYIWIMILMPSILKLSTIKCPWIIRVQLCWDLPPSQIIIIKLKRYLANKTE